MERGEPVVKRHRRPQHRSPAWCAVALALMVFATPACARPAPGTVTGARMPATELTAQVSTVYHIVSKGETLWSIANLYGLSIGRLSALNGYPDPQSLRPGQRLAITGDGTISASQITRLAKLLWPLHGTLTSLFGPRAGKLHTGIDIATAYGSEIHAAFGGRVDTATWLGSYGRTIIIDHGNGFATLYAHASRLLVRKGEEVTSGEVIAKVGSTGNSTGPHVHFEVRVDGKCVDPLRMLE